MALPDGWSGPFAGTDNHVWAHKFAHGMWHEVTAASEELLAKLCEDKDRQFSTVMVPVSDRAERLKVRLEQKRQRELQAVQEVTATVRKVKAIRGSVGTLGLASLVYAAVANDWPLVVASVALIAGQVR